MRQPETFAVRARNAAIFRFALRRASPRYGLSRWPEWERKEGRGSSAMSQAVRGRSRTSARQESESSTVATRWRSTDNNRALSETRKAAADTRWRNLPVCRFGPLYGTTQGPSCTLQRIWLGSNQRRHCEALERGDEAVRSRRRHRLLRFARNDGSVRPEYAAALCLQWPTDPLRLLRWAATTVSGTQAACARQSLWSDLLPG